MLNSSQSVIKDQDNNVLEKLAELSISRPVWIRVGQLFDGIQDHSTPDAHLVFDSRHILFAGIHGDQPSPELLADGVSHPDAVLPEYYVLPCLIEAHAHMFLDGAPIELAKRKQYLKESSQWMLDRARARRPALIQCGVGAVRDAGDKHGIGLTLSKEARASLGRPSRLPWIDSPGAAIYHRGQYGRFMAEPIEDHACAASCVASRVADGADRIKLLVSGIINFEVGRVTVPPQLETDEVAQIVQAARRHGRQTFAHASGSPGIENAIEGGVTSVEHGYFVTHSQLGRMRDRGIGWVPTFAPVQVQIDRAGELGWENHIVDHLKRIVDEHRQMLLLGHQMGVTILAGSDAGSCGVPHGLGLLSELVHLEQAGISTTEVLKSATGRSSRLLCFSEPVGHIEPGSRTRLIFTRHNPFETVANLQRDKTVLFDGMSIQGHGDLMSEGL
jgi:imidazolonepropionase-like amidohydrolase